jgi:hypothetical protein
MKIDILIIRITKWAHVALFGLPFLSPVHFVSLGIDEMILPSFFAMIIFSMWILTAKYSKLEDGGVYGHSHDLVLRIYGTPWGPPKSACTILISGGLGGICAGLIYHKQLSTFACTILVGALTGLIWVRFFERKWQLRFSQKPSKQGVPPKIIK